MADQFTKYQKIFKICEGGCLQQSNTNTREWNVRSLTKLITLVFVLFIFNVEAFAKVEKYRVWYIPLERNYYAPLTKEEIESKALTKTTKSNSKIDVLFLEALKKNKRDGATQGNDLRIKLQRQRDGAVLFVNRDKSVVFDDQTVSVPEKVVTDTVKLFEKK